MTERHLLPALALLAALATAIPAHAGKTLDAVRQRGTVKCGVTGGVAGFSAPDTQGRWTGLDADSCRAIAAAVLGDGSKVEFVPLNSQQRFSALQAGEIDILARNTTWNLTRDASLGFNFTTVNYYDGQGFLLPKKFKVGMAKDLRGATICTQAGTTNEKNVADWSRAQGVVVKTLVFESFEASYKAGHAPLGVAEDRRQTGAKREIDPPGKAKGGYAIVTYQTKFAKEAKCREEVVALRAMPDNTWRVAKHESSPQLVDCIGLEPVGSPRKD